jgi:hypothetical protein
MGNMKNDDQERNRMPGSTSGSNTQTPQGSTSASQRSTGSTGSMGSTSSQDRDLDRDRESNRDTFGSTGSSGMGSSDTSRGTGRGPSDISE